MFCQGQVGLTRLIKYSGLTWIPCIGLWVPIMAYGADQSNELSVLDSDDVSIQYLIRIDSTIRVRILIMHTWIMHCHTPQKYTELLTIFYI